MTEKLQTQYKKTKASYDKIKINGSKATLNAVWGKTKEEQVEGNIFHFSKDWHGKWKVSRTE